MMTEIRVFVHFVGSVKGLSRGKLSVPAQQLSMHRTTRYQVLI